MLKREWVAESNGKLLHLFIPSKTATEVPEFAMEDLSLGRIAALVPEFAVKDLPLGRTLMMMMMMMMMMINMKIKLLTCNLIIDHHHHQSVLPKGRSFTANSGTKVAVLLGMNRYSSFPLLSAPHSLFSI